MAFLPWFEQLQVLFRDRFGSSALASSAGWQWKEIYKEGLTPQEAFDDYLLTFYGDS